MAVPIKIVLLGDSGVGKTSLLHRFVASKFDESQPSSLMPEMLKKTITVDGATHTLQLWDTVGTERFNCLPPQFYRNVKGVVLVFDISRPQTFAKLDHWRNECLAHVDNENLPMFIVGNKTDLKRAVPKREGALFARKYEALYIETSAKNDKNVTELFIDFAEQCIPPKPKHKEPIKRTKPIPDSEPIKIQPNVYFNTKSGEAGVRCCE